MIRFICQICRHRIVHVLIIIVLLLVDGCVDLVAAVLTMASLHYIDMMMLKQVVLATAVE